MRIFSSFLAYANKARVFVQPTLSANGTIGGDSFAVCGRRFEFAYSGQTPRVVEEAYKAFDGDSSTKVTINGGASRVDRRLTFGVYNPNPIRMNSEPSITKENCTLRNIYGTNSKTVFDEAIELVGKGEMELVSFDKPRKYYKFYKFIFDSDNNITGGGDVYEIELHCSEKIKGV